MWYNTDLNWLRTEDKFDLQKVRQFLTIAQSRVI